jgi:hypothetical protein
LRLARARQRWLQHNQIALKFRPLRGLPEDHEAYFMVYASFAKRKWAFNASNPIDRPHAD